MAIWIKLCIGSVISFVILECIIVYSPEIRQACDHQILIDTTYMYCNYICLGAFLVLLLNLLLKLLFIHFDQRYIPLYISLAILLVSTITTFLQIKMESKYCVDMMNVASSPYLWGEWIACSPLLIYSTSIITAEELNRQDILITVTYTTSVFLGFLFIVAKPKELAHFFLVSSILAFMPTFYFPFYEPNLKLHPLLHTDMVEEVKDIFFHEKLKIRYKLSTLLCVILPIFPLIYLLGCFHAISEETTVITFNIMSVVTKGVYIEVCTGSYIYMITKVEDILVEVGNTNQVRRDFVKYIFHEVRTPFNSISIAIDLLEESKTIQEMERKYLKMMRDSCDNINETLNSVLTLQKLEDGCMNLEPGLYDIKTIVKKSYCILKGLIEQKQIDVEFFFSRNTPAMIYVDGNKLEHVLTNLIGNAIKFTPNQGQITVQVMFEYGTFLRSDSLSSKKPFLKLSKQLLTMMPKEMKTKEMLLMKVSITDDRPGISPEDTKNLFRTFVQIDSAKLQGEKGSGLGLSFCKTIVELHGGEIGVHSLEGQGTTFKFVIPIQQYKRSQVVENKVSSGSYNYEPSSISVLIVDDSSMNRKLLKDLMKLFSFDVHEAENGSMAVELVRRDVEKYKIVFLDNIMPVMNGIEAAEEMRKFKYKNIIFGLTGNSLEEDKNAFLAAGVNYVFTKPITKDKIKNIAEFVREHLCSIGTAILKESEDGLLIHEDVTNHILRPATPGYGISYDPPRSIWARVYDVGGNDGSPI